MVKRAVYFGGSAPLDEGLHMERTEFIKISPTETAQTLMVEYLERTARDGDLPLYQPAVFAETLAAGRFPVPSRGSKK